MNLKREIIAFIGRQGSGKSFQSKKLVTERGFQKLSFADPLREIAFNVIGMNFEEGMKQYNELKRTELINGLNFRNILENLGASIRRYDKDFWANALLLKIRNCPDNIVIDDMRYTNEYNIIRTFCATKGYDFRAYFCNFKSDIYCEDNPHESAHLSNYLAKIGYKDLQLIDKKDIFEYDVATGQVKTPNVSNVLTSHKDLKQKSEELIKLLKDF